MIRTVPRPGETSRSFLERTIAEAQRQREAELAASLRSAGCAEPEVAAGVAEMRALHAQLAADALDEIDVSGLGDLPIVKVH